VSTVVTRAELVLALGEGRELECLEASGSRLGIRADELRSIILDRGFFADPKGIRIHGARIDGPLDLSNTDLAWPVRFRNCVFTHPLDIRGAALRELAVSDGSELPALLANHVQIKGDLDLSRVRITSSTMTNASASKEAGVWLCEASVGGRMLFSGARIIVSPHVRSIQADRIALSGTARFIDGFTSTGEIRLIGAQIKGSLDFTSATISAEDVALDLGEADIGGSLFLVDEPLRSAQGPNVSGRIDMGNAHIRGRWMVKHATVQHPSRDDSRYNHVGHGGLQRVAISAPRLRVDGDLTIHDSVIRGALDLRSAEVGGDLQIQRGHLSNPGHTAIALAAARLGSIMSVYGQRPVADKATSPALDMIQGSIYAPGMQVYGSIDWSDVTLSRPYRLSDSSIVLNHSQIGGPVSFRRVVSDGFLRCANTEVRGDLSVQGGRFKSLQLDSAKVSHVLRIDGTSFSSVGTAVSLKKASAQSGMVLRLGITGGQVDLSDATTARFGFYSSGWPTRFSIKGLRFRAISDLAADPDGEVSGVLDWLDRQEPFDSSPYEQLAAALRAQGRPTDAENALIRGKRRSRLKDPTVATPRRWLDWVFDRSLGYGYRPGRMCGVLLALVIMVAMSVILPDGRELMRAVDPANNVYSPTVLISDLNQAAPRSGEDCGDGSIRCFNAVVFAVDTVVPLLDLGQRQTWYPDSRDLRGLAMQYWLATATIAGWVLSTVLVLSMARFARRIN
jgi:hypothetical protein